MESDKAAQVGKQLAQSLTQVSERGPKVFVEWTAHFVGHLRVLLGGIVPRSSPPYFRDFVARTYQTYAHASLPAQ
jgi:hypothetical protein